MIAALIRRAPQGGQMGDQTSCGRDPFARKTGHLGGQVCPAATTVGDLRRGICPNGGD
jgi:hypothetical protein